MNNKQPSLRAEIEKVILENVPVNYDHTKAARSYISEATDKILDLLLSKLPDGNEKVPIVEPVEGEPIEVTYYRAAFRNTIDRITKIIKEEI